MFAFPCMLGKVFLTWLLSLYDILIDFLALRQLVGRHVDHVDKIEEGDYVRV